MSPSLPMAGPVSGSGTPIRGLTDALLCFQLCLELHKGVSRLEAALKDMKSG